MKLMLEATFVSLLAGVCTSLGGITAFFFKNGISKRVYSAMLGISGGIMLAATFFSLLIPSIEFGGIYVSISGLILGALFIELIAKFVPHEHFFKGKEGPTVNIKRIFLFMLAITIHNFPEGMSVGVGWAMEDKAKAVALALGIGIQNIPEGAAIAMPLLSLGYSPIFCLWMSLLSGLVEPIGGLIGISVVSQYPVCLPFAFAFASGCMLYVISGEMIPESHEYENSKLATRWLIIGFCIMALLDNVFK